MSARIQDEPKNFERFMNWGLSGELEHAVLVSNLAYDVAQEMGLGEDFCYELAVAGMVHDIGKLKMSGIYNPSQKPMVVEQVRSMRTHPTLGYTELARQGYPDTILKWVLYHHENFDGSGYPGNLSGEDIPLGARILRVCDVYSALRSDRPYRKALSQQDAMKLMIGEINFFDMKVFLAFQRVVHKD